MRCAVFRCGNNNKDNKDIKFYTFPRDKMLLRKWIDFCKRKDIFNTRTSRVCSAHFHSDDIQINLQFEMGLCSKSNANKLKPGTIPTVEYSRAQQKSTSQTNLQNNKDDSILEAECRNVQLEKEKIKTVTEKPNTNKLEYQIKDLQTKVESLRKDNDILLERVQINSNNIEFLKKQLKLSESHRRKLEKQLAKIFPISQIDKVNNK